MEENVTTPEAKGGISKGLIAVILVVVIVLAAGAYEFTKPKGTNMMVPTPAAATPTAAQAVSAAPERPRLTVPLQAARARQLRAAQA